MREEMTGPSDDGARWSPIEGREWYAARDAVASLRDVLIAAGLERDFPYLRADLNAFGHGLVELGRISPETAERLAVLLGRALACRQETHQADCSDQRRTD